MGRIENVYCLKDVKVRYLGSIVYIEMVIIVDLKFIVEEGYGVVDEVEDKIKYEYDVIYVYVYVEFDDIK